MTAIASFSGHEPSRQSFGRTIPCFMIPRESCSHVVSRALFPLQKIQRHVLLPLCKNTETCFLVINCRRVSFSLSRAWIHHCRRLISCASSTSSFGLLVRIGVVPCHQWCRSMLITM
jgi:hypothetical protein